MTKTAPAIEDLDAHRADLARRVGHVESELGTLHKKIDSVAERFDIVSAKLFERLENLSQQTARVQAASTPYPERVGFVKDAAVLFAAVCTGIIFITQAALTPGMMEAAKKTAVLEYRMQQMEAMKPDVKFALRP